MWLMAIAVPTIVCIIWAFATKDSENKAILVFLLAMYAYLIWVAMSA